MKLVTAPLVAPQDAWTWYDGQPNVAAHTPGIANWTSPPAELQELARGLGAGRYSATVYANTVYEYIRDNIQVDFRFGLSKGARGAVIDQSGTAFDQAHLMVTLLRIGNVAASYQVGTITLNGTQFYNWTGFTNAAAACQFLADGGIPASVNGTNTCGGLSGSVSSVTMGHIWVSANSQLYDPAYKSHTFKSGMDVAAAIGCGTAASPSCGSTILNDVPTPTTFTGTTNVNFVQNVNQTTIDNHLSGFAKSLQSFIQGYNTNHGTNLLIDDLIGGMSIDASAAFTVGASLPYTASAHYTWTGDIPDVFRTTLQVQMAGTGCQPTACTPWFNQLFYADEIAGSRLRFWGVGGTNVTAAAYLEFRPLAQAVISNAGSDQTLTLTVNHPYAAGSGTYMDETLVQPNVLEGSFPDAYGQHPNVLTVLTGWGEASESTINHYSALQARDTNSVLMEDPTNPKNLIPTAVWTGFPLHLLCQGKIGPAAVANPNGPYQAYKCLEQHQPVAAATWLASTSRMRGVIGQLAATAIQHHHSLGYVLSGEGTSSNQQSLSFINVECSISANSLTGNASDRQLVFETTAAGFSRAEAGTFEQNLDAYYGTSGVGWLALANQKQIPLLEVTPANSATALPLLQSYSTDEMTAVNNYLNNGYTLILPRNGAIGQFTYGNSTTNLTINYTSTALAGFRSDRIAYLTQDKYKGGGGETSFDPLATTLTAVQQMNYSLKSRKTFEVSLASAALELTPPPDLVTGTGQFPYSLAVQRYYSSEEPLGGTSTCVGIQSQPCVSTYVRQFPEPSKLGGGWTHNFEISARVGSDALLGMGRNSALDAASAIAALYTLRTISNGTLGLQTRMATILTTDWWVKALQHNTVIVTLPPATHVFTALPDGSFNPPPGNADQLQQTGTLGWIFFSPVNNLVFDYANIGFTLHLKDGSILTLPQAPSPVVQGTANDLFLPTSWSFPDGVQIAFSYATSAVVGRSNCLATVSNNLGHSLTYDPVCTTAEQINSDSGDVQYHPWDISFIQDENGRQVQFTSIHQFGSDPGGHNLADLAVPTSFIVTEPDNTQVRYDYESHPNVPIARPYPRIYRWFTPTDLATNVPDETVTYDSLYRVAGITDNSATPHTTSYFSSGIYGSELLKRGEESDPQRWDTQSSGTTAVTTDYFDEFASRTSSTDPLGFTTYFSYDTYRRLAKTVFPEQNTEVYAYDVRHNKLSTTRNPKPGSGYAPITTSVSYEESPTATTCANWPTCNLEATTTDALGRVTTFSYLANGQLQRIVWPVVAAQTGGVSGSAQTDYCYTSYGGTSGLVSMLSGKIAKVDSSTNRVVTYAYTAPAMTLLSVVVDPTTTLIPPSGAGGACTTGTAATPHNFTTGLTFDAIGNVATITDPLTNTTGYTFDKMRRLTSITAPLGDLTRYCYDVDGNLISANRTRAVGIADPNVSTATTTGQCSSAFAPASWQSELRTYLPTGDLLTVTDARGDVTTYGYDPDGRKQIEQDGDGRQTATLYDLTGQVAATWRGGSGWINTSSNLPALGNIPAAWNPATYTGTGPLRYAQYTYNPNGTRHTETDADGNTTTSSYDGFDRLTQTLYADGLSDNFWYTQDGTAATTLCSASSQPCRKITRSGNYISYTYDTLDRRATRTPQVEGGYTYGYNLLGEPLAIFKLGQGSTPGHSTLYGWDTAGHKKSESDDGHQVSYQFDGNGNRTQLIWPDGYYVQYKYDTLNRMSCALQNGTGELAYYNYDPLSQRNYVRFAGQGTNCQPGNGSNQTSYIYEPNSDVSSLTQTLNGASVTLGYSHNNSHQINGLNSTDDFYLPVPAPGTSTAYVPKALNQYASVAGHTMTYDQNGNLTTLFPGTGSQSYVYDTENRLIKAAVTGSTSPSVFYDYDALERRVTSTAGGSALATGGTTTNFLLDGEEEIAELDSSGNVMRRYIPGPRTDERIAVAEGSSTLAPTLTYFHVNHEGSVMAMTDAAGNASGCASGVNCQRLAYDEYGNLSTAAAGTGEPYRFTGRRYDVETGMYYYRARYYSPDLGRFMQMDPVGSKDDPNLYAYVHDDPLDRADASGRTGEATLTGCALTAEIGCAPGALVGALVDAGIIIISVWAATEVVHHHEQHQDAGPKPADSPPPDRTANDELRKDQNGQPKPDPEAEGTAHTQLGTRNNSKAQPGKTYPNAQEFDEQGKPVREIDFTDHGMPKQHPNPHQHVRGPEPNPGAGRPKGPPTGLPDPVKGPQRPKWWWPLGGGGQ